MNCMRLSQNESQLFAKPHISHFVQVNEMLLIWMLHSDQTKKKQKRTDQSTTVPFIVFHPHDNKITDRFCCVRANTKWIDEDNNNNNSKKMNYSFSWISAIDCLTSVFMSSAIFWSTLVSGNATTKCNMHNNKNYSQDMRYRPIKFDPRIHCAFECGVRFFCSRLRSA